MKWVNVKDRLPIGSCILRAKNKDREISKCYFHHDKMAWLSFYDKGERFHFQDKKTLKFLNDIIEWEEIDE